MTQETAHYREDGFPTHYRFVEVHAADHTLIHSFDLRVDVACNNKVDPLYRGRYWRDVQDLEIIRLVVQNKGYLVMADNIEPVNPLLDPNDIHPFVRVYTFEDIKDMIGASCLIDRLIQLLPSWFKQFSRRRSYA